MNFRLNLRDYPTFELAIASIQEGVTSLDLRENALGYQTGAELAAALASIKDSVTSLNLSGNILGRKNGAELATALAGIKDSVTSLNLSENILGYQTGAELATAFSGIKEGITSLDISHNNLRLRSAQELRAFIQAIPSHVTSINLRNNNLFKNKSPKAIDAFLLKLGDVRGRLDLSHNGESEFSRAVVPLIQMDTSVLFEKRLSLPPEVKGIIASYLSGLPATDMSRVIQERAEVTESQTASWMQLICNMSSMLAQLLTLIHLATLALGAVILLSCSSVGMLTLGAGLALSGGAGLAANACHAYCTKSEEYGLGAAP